jgi:UPF0755 protein
MTKKIIKIIFLAKLLFLFSLLVFFYWGIYLPKNNIDEDKIFIVRAGDSLSFVAKKLEEEKIIKKDYFFITYGLLTKKGRELKPGSYKFSSTMNVSEILEKIASGGEERLTIIEGWNLREVAIHLEEKGYGTKEEFYHLAGAPPFYDGEKLIESQKANIVFIEEQKNLSLEGFLFPDTYFISPGTPMEEIIATFLSNFEDKINKEIEEMIEKEGTTLFETIIIASLLEKEVTSFEDKQIVSGIIRRRLEKGMRLQLDATVTYLTGRKSVQIPITETRIRSSYNTYVYDGLPVGPICNPGIESIKAALLPKETDYLYYLSKPTGETVFNRTFDEHVVAKNKYLKQ